MSAQTARIPPAMGFAEDLLFGLGFDVAAAATRPSEFYKRFADAVPAVEPVGCATPSTQEHACRLDGTLL